MIFQNEDPSAELPWPLRPFSSLAGHIQGLYANFRYEITDTLSLYLNLIDVSKQNRALLETNRALKNQLQLLEELRKENKRFSQLLGFHQAQPMKLRAAKVIGTELISNREALILNKGSQHGLKVTMPVIVPEGVVGYLSRVRSHSSQVLLITDPYVAVDGLVQRSRVRLLVEGNNSSYLRSTYFKNPANIKVHDLIVTSGLDNVFPKGFPLGQVVSVTSDKYSTNPLVKIQPRASLNQLEEVFVIIKLNKQKKIETKEKSDE